MLINPLSQRKLYAWLKNHDFNFHSPVTPKTVRVTAPEIYRLWTLGLVDRYLDNEVLDEFRAAAIRHITYFMYMESLLAPNALPHKPWADPVDFQFDMEHKGTFYRCSIAVNEYTGQLTRFETASSYFDPFRYVAWFEDRNTPVIDLDLWAENEDPNSPYEFIHDDITEPMTQAWVYAYDIPDGPLPYCSDSVADEDGNDWIAFHNPEEAYDWGVFWDGSSYGWDGFIISGTFGKVFKAKTEEHRYIPEENIKARTAFFGSHTWWGCKGNQFKILVTADQAEAWIARLQAENKRRRELTEKGNN